MKPIHINNPYIYIAIFTIAWVFAGCEQTVTSDQNLSSDELNSELNAQQGPTLEPVPVVSHSVEDFSPYLSWSHIPDAIEYKIRREKCCTSTGNFVVSDTTNTTFQDGEILHPYLEAVDIAVPDKWLRYRVKAIYSNDESPWSSWKYFKIPDDQQW